MRGTLERMRGKRQEKRRQMLASSIELERQRSVDTTNLLDEVRWRYSHLNLVADETRQRAVTLLGFTGVIFAALLAGVFGPLSQSASRPWWHLAWWQPLAVYSAFGLLICSALASVLTLVGRNANTPSNTTLIDFWDRYKGDTTRTGTAQQQILEMHLGAGPVVNSLRRCKILRRKRVGTSTSERPLESLRRLNNERVHKFNIAVYFMLAAFIALSVSLIPIFTASNDLKP